MRAQHPTTADEIDYLVHREGDRRTRAQIKRASVRRDRRAASRNVSHLARIVAVRPAHVERYV